MRLVSILIPAFNAEKWIAETIRSAIGQDWQRKEIIVVDDGSRDGTLAVAKRFESRGVKVVTQENRGASAARNFALSLAQGDYIQWLDADDLLHPGKISQQIRVAESGSSRDLLAAACGNFFFAPERARFSPNLCWQDLPPVEWLVTWFNQGVGMLPHQWLVSRELCELAGPWDERLSLADDAEYSCRLICASDMVRFVAKSKCYYRTGNFNSLVHKRADNARESMFLAISMCIDHLLDLENSERTREACRNHLSNNVFEYYPGDIRILSRMNRLATELGGGELIPRVSTKFRTLAGILGWENARRLKVGAWRAGVLVRRNWDLLIYMLQGH